MMRPETKEAVGEASRRAFHVSRVALGAAVGFLLLALVLL